MWARFRHYFKGFPAQEKVAQLMVMYGLRVHEGNVYAGEIKLSDNANSKEVLQGLKGIQGLTDKLGALGIKPKDPEEVQISAAEFVLEGLYAHKRIGRSEERVFTAGEKQPRRPEKPYEHEDPSPRPRRPYN